MADKRKWRERARYWQLQAQAAQENTVATEADRDGLLMDLIAVKAEAKRLREVAAMAESQVNVLRGELARREEVPVLTQASQEDVSAAFSRGVAYQKERYLAWARAEMTGSDE
jgi:hypothetical protein